MSFWIAPMMRESHDRREATDLGMNNANRSSQNLFSSEYKFLSLLELG